MGTRGSPAARRSPQTCVAPACGLLHVAGMLNWSHTGHALRAHREDNSTACPELETQNLRGHRVWSGVAGRGRGVAKESTASRVRRVRAASGRSSLRTALHQVPSHAARWGGSHVAALRASSAESEAHSFRRRPWRPSGCASRPPGTEMALSQPYACVETGGALSTGEPCRATLAPPAVSLHPPPRTGSLAVGAVVSDQSEGVWAGTRLLFLLRVAPERRPAGGGPVSSALATEALLGSHQS